jgi:hypothetical protein
LSGWHDRTLVDLLAAYGLTGAVERPFPTDGWSGASFSALERDGRRYVLKRMSLAVDWIARATADADLREAWLADASETRWPAGLTAPYLGAAADGEGAAILMPDLSADLIAWDRPGDSAIDAPALARLLRAMARLHASPWSLGLEASAASAGLGLPPWCPLPERLLLLARPAARAYAAAGNPVGERFLAGWDAFDRSASSAARDLVEGLSLEPGPLMRVLASLPSVGLHGDLKLANVALLRADDVGLIDWQLTLRAPVAVELGWFLVANSGSLAERPERVLASYRAAIAGASRESASRTDVRAADDGRDIDDVVGDWAVQADLAWIVGLLLRGWRKGLDAEAGRGLPSGVSGADDLAWWCRHAVEAGERRL